MRIFLMAIAFTATLGYLCRSEAAFRGELTHTIVARVQELAGEARDAIKPHLPR